MKKSIFLMLLGTLLPATVHAAPTESVVIGADKVLRGRFVDERQVKGMADPMRTSGHFIVAPTTGLIWGIEKPFPTSTIITPDSAAQDIGGMAVKLPVKNLRHLYDVIKAALAGNWSGLNKDFAIADGSKDVSHWQRILTPRPDGAASLPYATITVSGSAYVEEIMMKTVDGRYDHLIFSDEILSPLPLQLQEERLFSEASRGQ